MAIWSSPFTSASAQLFDDVFALVGLAGGEGQMKVILSGVWGGGDGQGIGVGFLMTGVTSGSLPLGVNGEPTEDSVKNGIYLPDMF